MKNKIGRLNVLLVFFLMSTVTILAQRKMENLDHATMAVKTANGVYVSWRVLGSEWKDVSYNLYREGVKLNDEPIAGASNYEDAAGTLTSLYFVRAIVDGVEQAETCTAKVWDKSYIDIPVNDIEGNYTINDASLGDLDGDGEYEIIIKRKSSDIGYLARTNYHLLQAYHLDPEKNLNDQGEVVPMWTIDMGPNLFNDVEVNFLVWDVDQDGKAELITRTSDATIDGLGKDFGDTDNDGKTDYRYSCLGFDPDIYSDPTRVEGYRTAGPDYLSVFDGMTGGEIARDQYIKRDPMEQYGSSGAGAAHRSTKCMFTIAYLDGKKPSIVISRGIYERIKMEAWDFDGTSLSKRWTFDTQNAPPEYHGSGNHNLSLADVDFDGKDEIVYGAMVIDDDGTGLHSNGLMHGDAIHVGDFDPDRFGLEIWRCLENNTGAMYKTGETGEEIVRYRGNRDNGRCCAGDINPDSRGAEVWAATECPTYNSKGEIINPASPFPMNFMVWWDGDLLREFLDHTWNEPNGVGQISKRTAGDNRVTLLNANGTLTNNWTKGTPCVSADIYGDWREEVVWRRSDNKAIRLYFSTTPTTHRLYTLMHDSQYREAIAWQMDSYNQPPHPSFFLGYDMDSVPPPCILTNELVWKQGPTWDVSATSWDKNNVDVAFSPGDDVLFDLSGNQAVSVTGILEPRSVRVQTATDYTFDGTGSISGDMDFIKAGIGKLTLNNDNDFSGITRVYLGKLEVNGDLSNSHVIVKRFAELYGSGTVGNGVLLQNGSALYAGKENGEATQLSMAGDLKVLGNANIYLDLSENADGSIKSNDKLVVDGNITLEDENTLHINMLDGDLEASEYELITFTGDFTGDLADITIAGIAAKSVELKLNSNALVLVVNAIRSASDVIWEGDEDNNWDLATTKNWLNNGVKDYFVGNDNVTINDDGAANTSINLTTGIPVGSLTVNSSLNYTFEGAGTLVGEAGLTKLGTGRLRIANENEYTGATEILEGEISVPKLENGGVASSLGSAESDASKLVLNGGVLSVTNNGILSTNRSITVGDQNGTLSIPLTTGSIVLEGTITGSGSFIKDGPGTLTFGGSNSHNGTIIKEGTLKLGSEDANVSGLGGSVTLEGGTLAMQNSTGSYTVSNWDIIVPEGARANLNVDGRVQMKGSLTGSGNLSIYTPFVRTDFRGNWSEFMGTINVTAPSGGGDFRVYNNRGYANASVKISSNVNFYVENNGGATVLDIGNLTMFGSGTLAGTTGYFTWRIGANNANSLVYGTIRERGTTGIEKVGTGNMTLSGANTYKRYTYVNGGAVICNNTSGSATGLGPVSINATGTLKGSGSSAGLINVNQGGVLTGTLTLGGAVTVADGGTIAPGSDGTLGTLQMDKTLALTTGSNYLVDVNADSKSSDLINVVGVVMLDGVLTVNNLGSSAYQVGDTYHIIDAPEINGQFSGVVPSRPATGLDWDLSDIQNGNVGVMKATALKDISVLSIGIIPNPSHGNFIVKFDDYLSSASYEVVDMTGATVKTGELSGVSEFRVNMEDHAKGLYLLKINYRNKVATRRIVLD